MRRFLKKLFGQNVATESVSEVDSDDDISWLFPPATMVESAPWDQFWRDQLSHGVAGFVHLFCDDGELVDVMRANGFKTVLCIGNGISQEPRALSWAGFDVTALDLSPFATEVASGAAPPDEFLAELVGGRSGGLNGQLEFVVGDVCDEACCPGRNPNLPDPGYKEVAACEGVYKK